MRRIAFLAAAAAIAWPAVGATAAELRVGFTEDPLTLDPANHRNRQTETIIRNMYDGLMTRNAEMEVVPEIAESWRPIDATTYEFKLRKGIKFHSGDVLTVEDVKYTFDRLTQEDAMGGQTSPRQSLLGPVTEVKIIDDETVHFMLDSPWPILPAMLPFQEVVSKAFVERVGSEGMATQTNGTGPFKLVEWRRGDSVIMERFDDYYGGAADIPPVEPAAVDRVIFKIIPENSSRLAALLSGEVDIVSNLPAHMMKQIDNNPDTRVMTVRGTRSSFIALNTWQPPFNDERVRKAANHALNRELIIDKILNGTATPVNGVLSPDAFAFNPDLPSYQYDPEKAKALLAEAGLADGIDVVLDTDAANKDLAEAMAAMLTESNIRTTVQVWEASVARDLWRNNDKKERDMWLSSWGNGSLDPVGIFVPTLRTKDRGNASGYSNTEVDELLDMANTEIDRDRRAQLYRDAQVMVNAEAPWIFLWVAQEIYGVSNRVEGWQPSSDSRINLHDARIVQ